MLRLGIVLLPLVAIAASTSVVLATPAYSGPAVLYELEYLGANPGGNLTLINSFTNQGTTRIRVVSVHVYGPLGNVSWSSPGGARQCCEDTQAINLNLGEKRVLHLRLPIPSETIPKDYRVTARAAWQFYEPTSYGLPWQSDDVVLDGTITVERSFAPSLPSLQFLSSLNSPTVFAGIGVYIVIVSAISIAVIRRERRKVQHPTSDSSGKT